MYDASECWDPVGGKDRQLEGCAGTTTTTPPSTEKTVPRKGSHSNGPTLSIKPKFVFQDPVSKVPWASCDFSGDGEYILGGCNTNPNMVCGPKHGTFCVSLILLLICLISGLTNHILCAAVLIQGDCYELYLWNARTGELLDRLTGPQVSM